MDKIIPTLIPPPPPIALTPTSETPVQTDKTGQTDLTVEHVANTGQTAKLAKAGQLPSLAAPAKGALSSPSKAGIARIHTALGHAKVDLTDMLVLLTKMDSEYYRTEGVAGAAELTMQLHALSEKAQSLRKEAGADLAAGIVKGAFEIGAAAVNFAGAVKMGSVMASNPGASDAAINTATMRINLVTSGLSQGVQGLGTVGSSIATYQAQEEKADQVADDKTATLAENMQTTANRNMQEAMSTFDSISGIIRNVIDMRHEVAEKALY